MVTQLGYITELWKVRWLLGFMCLLLTLVLAWFDCVLCYVHQTVPALLTVSFPVQRAVDRVCRLGKNELRLASSWLPSSISSSSCLPS